jgi:4-amino-4-deoxy-L-arabinose transferase-like glycosyltransferase
VFRIARSEVALALFISSLVIRLVALWAFPDLPLDTNATLAYLPGARLLIEGDGFRDPSFSVLSPPVYSMVIALSSLIFRDGEFGVKVLQALADSGTVVIIYLITIEIFDRRTAILTGSAWVLYPFAIYTALYIGPESIFTCALSGTMLATVYAIKTQSLRYYCAAGFLLGLTTLIRGTTQWFPLFLVICFGLVQPRTRKVFFHSLGLLVFFGLVIMPWGIRNYLVLKEIIPIATSGGMVFLWGSSDEFLTIDERERRLPAFLDKVKERAVEFPGPSSGPSEKSKFLFRAGVENYKIQFEADPLSLGPFLIRKFFRLWYSTESGERHMVILGINLLIYIFAVAGMMLAFKKRNRLSIVLVCVVAYFALLHWATLPLFRYMMPIMPYVMAFGAYSFLAIATEASTLTGVEHDEYLERLERPRS